MTTADDTRGTLSTVRSAARLLKEFRSGSREFGVSELARRLGLGKSTAHRLLTTLAREGLLEHDPGSGTYRLGLVMYELGEAVKQHFDLHAAAVPVMEALRNATHETVQIAVLDGHEVVYVERLESPHTLRLFTQLGRRMPAHCTGTGKLLLAFLPADRLDALLAGAPLEPRTPYTITDPRALREELARTRARGWSENAQESEIGVASVGAPIRDARGTVVAAISIAGPVMRLDGDSLGRFTRQLIDAAGTISRQLGWSPSREISG